MAVISSPCTIFSVFPFLFLFTFSLSELKNDGFTIDLIHRDYIISPLHNSTASYSDIIKRALQRSKSRADYFAFRSFASGSPTTDVKPSNGNFLIKLSIGMPPFQIIGILDTGSALSWTQCTPCDNCFPQKLPLFTPKESSTYKVVPGNSKLCKSLKGRPSVLGDNTCRYSLFYFDKSSSHGTISFDTVTMNSTSGMPISHQNFIFGCGYENMGEFNEDTSGVIGLGPGAGSLITQMDSVIGGKFSYCLLSNAHNNLRSSKMHFGSRAAVSGASVVSTGLYIFKNSFYSLKYKGISVGKQKFAMATPSNSSSSSKILGFFTEQIIIDSGVLLTHLPKKLYTPSEAAVRKEIKLEQADPQSMMRLCYKTPDGSVRGPIITIHFVGANVRLYPINTFLKVSKIVHCLGFVAHGVAILGNLAQVNYLVGFDLRRKIVSFKQTDCSKE